MENKKEFIIFLVSIIIIILLIFGGYFLWNRMLFGNLQRATKKAAKEAGVEIDTQDASPKGQVNAVRDMMEKIQDKRNAEIEKEL